jgi:hypothetical protein
MAGARVTRNPPAKIVTSPSPQFPERTPRITPDAARILRDCRDLATHRFVLCFGSALDRVSDLLIGRAQRSTDPGESSTLMGARDLIRDQRAQIVSGFETIFRKAIDERIGGPAVSPVPGRTEALELKLLDDSEMEESVVVGNVARLFDDSCEAELVPLTRRVGLLLGEPDLELVGNPFAPVAVFNAFRTAWSSAGAPSDQRMAVLRELNAAVLGDVKSIYADLNRHLVNLNVLADLHGGLYRRQAGAAAKTQKAESAEEVVASGEELMTTLQRVLKRAGGGRFAGPGAKLAAVPQFKLVPGADAGEALGGLIGAVGGEAAAVDAPVVSALTRLQQGDSGFDLGDGTLLQVSAVAAPKHNVLRDIRDSALGERMNQIDAMTIELVAMLFDFVFVDRDVADGIKALVGRLQIPVLKAAMLDRAFFSKKTHPARVLVNGLGHAGVGWSPEMGQDDPLYRKIESIVARICEGFTDDLDLFTRLHDELVQFLAEEEQRADTTLRDSAAEVERRDRRELARLAASAEVEKRLLQPLVPTFVINLLRRHWVGRLEELHVRDGDASDSWANELALLDDLVWSVQPKRSPEERKRLTGMLPSLLKRMNPALDTFAWEGDERKTFFGNLVEAHAAAVKATTPVHAFGPEEEVVPAVRVPADLAFEQDEYTELATTMARGMWVEFEAEDGKLTYAKLAWVSPLRGTLLFTNRQGQQAFSLTPHELADRFRGNRARPVDAEPLVDRAFNSMMARLTEDLPEAAAA